MLTLGRHGYRLLSKNVLSVGTEHGNKLTESRIVITSWHERDADVQKDIKFKNSSARACSDETIPRICLRAASAFVLEGVLLTVVIGTFLYCQRHSLFGIVNNPYDTTDRGVLTAVAAGLSLLFLAVVIGLLVTLFRYDSKKQKAVYIIGFTPSFFVAAWVSAWLAGFLVFPPALLVMERLPNQAGQMAFILPGIVGLSILIPVVYVSFLPAWRLSGARERNYRKPPLKVMPMGRAAIPT